MTIIIPPFDYPHGLNAGSLSTFNTVIPYIKPTVYMTVATMQKANLHHNMALARLFHEMSECYRYLGPTERFRAIAYDNVAKVLHNMKEDIRAYASDIQSLDQLGGIGESIAEKIIEYLNTGKIETFEKLKHRVPFELLELMDVTGFGPATLKVLHEQKGINNRKDLIQAMEENKLAGLEGFGERRIDNMRRALKMDKDGERIPLAKAEQIGKQLLGRIRALPGVIRAELAGSLRRKKETIGDIDILIAADTKRRKKIVDQFVQIPGISKVMAKGSTKASVLYGENKTQVDVRLVHPYEFGSALLYLTGSKEHNIKLRIIARDRGYKINEYGLYEIASGNRVAGDTEESMYDYLGVSYIPPEQRLGKDEIEEHLIR